MSTQPEKIVYSASWRDFIFANFSEGSFSTATPGFANYRRNDFDSRQCVIGHNSGNFFSIP